ncbi:uncharacterized protein LOC106052398 [Biomphalaria glabrata]|uniref:Uncharacterized protein LOC106052398 n=1 Tax=Biomphalaria glabrata TaxID=6526 RepID=A0A9W2YDZ2_BIOGL|nr:uncharacterized protein LOC106052398 [Biomphalaria glabrata]
MATLELVFLLGLVLISQVFCQETCVAFQVGAFSSNKMTTARGFMHCEISLPCTETDVLNVMALEIYLEIYSLPATRLARLDETQKVDISRLDLEGLGSIKSNGTSTFSVQFNPETWKNGDTFQCRAVVRNKENNVVNITTETSLALPNFSASKATISKIPDLDYKVLPMDPKPLDFGGHQYLLSKYGGDSAGKANGFCESQGGYLVEIDTEDEFKAIVTFLRSKNLAPNTNVFIGGTDVLEESKWVFQHSGGKVQYFNWHKGQPDNYWGGEHCMDLGYYFGVFLMNDISCMGDVGSPMFMCEFELN